MAAIATRAAVLLALAFPAHAAPSACPEHHPGGQAPDVPPSARTVELCNRAFAVLHSGLSRGPLWSGEHLTRSGVTAAERLRRVNAFHPDARLPATDRAELRDYAQSTFDRGHMTPSGDMPDAAAQAESFALSNMVPQWPALNRGPWERMEASVRDLARRHGEVWVVTGPAFLGGTVQAVGRVLVPTVTWKAAWVPGEGAAVWWAVNDAGEAFERITLDELERRSGVRVFPAMLEGRNAVAAFARSGGA